MSQAVSKAQLGQVVALLSTTLDKDSTKASTALSALDQRVQNNIHGKLWEVMGRPDYHHYGSIAFTDPSKLPENLRPTAQQKFTAVNNYLMTFPSYLFSLKLSIKQSSMTPDLRDSLIPTQSDLPADLALYTFRFLSLEDLASVARVAKEWNVFSQATYLAGVVSVLSDTLDEDSTKAFTSLKGVDSRIQGAIHVKLWEVMGRPNYQNYGGIAFTNPSQLPENLRPTTEQRFAAVNNYLMTFSFYASLVQQSLSRISKDISTEPAPAQPGMPSDLTLQAFGFLSPEDLARASLVCKDWRALASTNRLWQAFDLSKVCPSLKIIDEAVWERHVDLAALGLDASGAPAIDKRALIPFIKKLSSQVESDAGVTLLTMPKGLTLNKLTTLAAAPKLGPATQFQWIWRRIVEVLGNIAVDKTYTLAMTNSVLKDRSNKTIDAHRVLVQKNGGELPGFLPAATLAFLTYVSSPEGQPPTRLYGDEPWTSTRCSEQINGFNVAIGGFNLAGLLGYNPANPITGYFGAAVARKL